MIADTPETLHRISEHPVETDEASAPFVGKWNRLVSRTNWEKGRIINHWREALIEAGAAPYDHSDEAWAMRVGGVSAQHVGRLRRVWQRFGPTYEQYDGLYWSHFLVAMDWDDAEMWLEGAAQTGWSVSQMRAARWEALGAPDELKPRDEDVLASEWDEDSPLRPIDDALRVVAPEQSSAEDDDAGAPLAQRGGPTNGEPSSAAAEGLDGPDGTASRGTAVAPVRPFAELPELPEDLAEAFEQFKIAILAHRMSGWQETSCERVVAALEALKALVLAPVE